MKIAIYTLGCKVNQYETQAMEKELQARGHELVTLDEPFDAAIINTCTVTAVSDKKSRQAIRRAKKDNPDAVIAVCGCYAQTAPGDVEKLDVDLIAGSSNRNDFLDTLERVLQERVKYNTVRDILSVKEFEILPAGGMEGRTRAMLKVEDGCTNFCSYCIIPYARGRVRSIPVASAVEQAKQLEAEGYREIVITGIEISSYGRDLEGKPGLIDLIEEICSSVPDIRIRLGSLEPRTITEEFCSRIAKLPNLCPQFHLSMQSGCDSVLKRMNRRYDTARYYESVELLRKYYEMPAITTDLIVGFPGETEEEFRQTLEFIRKCRFSAMHVFPYSRRTGTPAAEMKEQILNETKETRTREAAAAASQMKEAFLKEHVGTVQRVLFEEIGKSGLWQGHTGDYIMVCVQGDDLHNQFRNVLIERADDGCLIGSVVEE